MITVCDLWAVGISLSVICAIGCLLNLEQKYAEVLDSKENK